MRHEIATAYADDLTRRAANRALLHVAGWNPALQCRGCDQPALPGYVNCAPCLEERGNA